MMTTRLGWDMRLRRVVLASGIGPPQAKRAATKETRR